MNLGAAERLGLNVIRAGLRTGSLTLRWPDGSVDAIHGKHPGPRVDLEVHDPRLVRRVLTGGANGLADSYIDADFDTDDLIALVELGALAIDGHHGPRVPDLIADPIAAGWRRAVRAWEQRGPVRDIVHHYDLGNEFYASWLDPSLTYSSALFTDPGMTLEQAQHEKYRQLAQITGVRPGARVLEIGSGWGGFARHLAGELDAEVTTITVSREQALYVEKLMADEGLSDRVHVHVWDFLDTPGTYDHVVSVEMIESIPQARWGEYFATVRARLVPGGTAGLQIITVADRHWKASNAGADFVRRYIFPGGQVPSVSILRDLARAHGMTWKRADHFGESYARTTAEWLSRFDDAWPQIAAMGFDERFRRMWRYYLAYCSGGFRSGRVDVGQIVLRKEDPWP